MKNKNRQLNQFLWFRAILFLSLFFISLICFLSLSPKANSASQCDSSNITVASQTARETEISADGTIRINGKPFFPFGVYHVSWVSSVEERSRHLQEIADAGFNTVHASFKQEDDLNSYGKFLDQANRLGVKVFTEFGLEPKIDPLVIVNHLKRKPAVLGWNIADDAGTPTSNPIKPDQASDMYCEVKNTDPDHLTYISGSLYKLLNFANFADAIGFQAYPVGSNPLDSLGLTYELIAKIVSSVPQNRVVIANTQAFQRYEENSVVPTSQQLRNMTYQSLLAGAKGIIYFNYYEADKWYLPEHPDLWQGIQSLVPEVEQISPMLLTGKRQKVRTRTKDVLSNIWSKENQSLVIVINTSTNSSKKISLDLPANNIQAAFHSDTDNLKFENGKLSGILPPLAVSVYRFQAT